MKQTQLRIWRVEPISKTGVRAPYFFVETTEKIKEKALISCEKIARTKSGLLKYDDIWFPNIVRMNVRKDNLGRYWDYHQ